MLGAHTIFSLCAHRLSAIKFTRNEHNAGINLLGARTLMPKKRADESGKAGGQAAMSNEV
jgi:hypothetical protein